jgi:adenylate cyclase, class 2
MKIEIEAKMPLHAPAELRRRLQAIGATPGKTIIETNTYFDTPQASLKTADHGLRLRIEREHSAAEESVTLTYKGARAHGKLKSRSEIEVPVGDPQAAAQLLTALGFSPVFTFEKRRQVWHAEGCEVALDQLPYLGWFVEIEGPSDQAVLALRERLQLGLVPLIHGSYIAMLRNYLSERHIPADRASLETADDEPVPAK